MESVCCMSPPSSNQIKCKYAGKWAFRHTYGFLPHYCSYAVITHFGVSIFDTLLLSLNLEKLPPVILGYWAAIAAAAAAQWHSRRLKRTEKSRSASIGGCCCCCCCEEDIDHRHRRWWWSVGQCLPPLLFLLLLLFFLLIVLVTFSIVWLMPLGDGFITSCHLWAITKLILAHYTTLLMLTTPFSRLCAMGNCRRQEKRVREGERTPTGHQEWRAPIEHDSRRTANNCQPKTATYTPIAADIPKTDADCASLCRQICSIQSRLAEKQCHSLPPLPDGQWPPRKWPLSTNTHTHIYIYIHTIVVHYGWYCSVKFVPVLHLRTVWLVMSKWSAR